MPASTATTRVPADLSARPWGLSTEGRAEVLRALRFRHFKWDTYACGSCLVLDETLVLDTETHARIVRTVEALHRGLSRFEAAVGREPDAMRRLGIPAELHRLIGAERETPLQCARYDLFPTMDGRWMVSEFNEDVPGGFNEAMGLPELLGDPGQGMAWAIGLRERFVAAFRDYECVALLYATAFSEDLQHMLVLERWLEAAGHRVVLASPAHLRSRLRRPRILSGSVDAAFRFYPGEWMPRLPNLRAWRRLAPRLPVMNPLRRLTRQSKAVFALWQEYARDPEDLALLEEHCPRTELFDPADIPRLRDERRRWVLKRAFGRMGDAVTIGALVSDAEWHAALVNAAANAAEYCVQERFLVRPVAFEAGHLYPTVGAFVVNGRFAGYYSRVAAQPFITHKAHHVATLVQVP